MKILFFGDSITDMCRNRETDFTAFSYGNGYPFLVQAELGSKYPKQYEILNRGISGNRVVDLYARIKCDCWNLNPDVVSILIGINDIWHEIARQNGVDIERYERVYRMILEDTKKRLPDVKFMLLEPFVLEGEATKDNLEAFETVREYAKVVKKLAAEYGAIFVPLQDKFDEAAAKNGASYYLADGVHPSIVGANLIATEWLKAFEKIR